MPSEDDLVSVIIPSYNHRQYLGRAIESIINQSHRNFECIVIDDGSVDGSYEYFSEFYRNDSRIHISRRENRGAHTTINEGLEQARGQFLAILNSDDAFAERRLEFLVKSAKVAGRPFFGITGLEIVDEHDAQFSGGPSVYYQRVTDALINGGKASAFWTGNVAMTTSNFFFSRTVWEETGAFRSLRYTHDWDWALRASERFGVTRLNESLLRYRVHGKNTISEPDIWSHIAENSFIFATSLQRMPLLQQEARTGIPAPEVMGYLLRNESFIPLATLYLLSLGKDDKELLSLIATGVLKQELQKVLEKSGMAFDLMLSAGHLQQQILASKNTEEDRRDAEPAMKSTEVPRRTKNWFRRLLPF